MASIRTWIGGAAAAVVVAGAAYVASDFTLLARYATYDGDPMTAGVDWYQPKDPVIGANRGELPAADRPTIDAAALDAAAAFAAAQKSSSLIVVRRGAIEREVYWNGATRETWFNPQSMSKTVLALMVGEAIADGHIAAVDDTLGKYIAEWRDDPRGAITIRQALWMATGLEQMAPDNETRFLSRGVRYNFGSDFVGHLLTLRQVEPAGTRFDYNNEVTNLLGLVVERASKRRYVDYLSAKIWQPLGLADAAMYLDRPGGVVMKSCCIFSRPIDWARIGLMIKDRGVWNDRPVVPSAWIDEMTAPSPHAAHYGYQVWLGSGYLRLEDQTRPDGTVRKKNASEPYDDPDMIVLNGYGNQRVWISRAHDLVIVRGADAWAPAWDDTFIPNTLIRGIRE
ncbi:MAG: serine hydrolase [Rhodospirillaceae bacterium]|nr:serine hydrolase [Rhodospirillaceae bacterium]